MKTYIIYIPSHTHDDFEVGKIEHYPARNEAILHETGKAAKTFYSVNAAVRYVQQRYGNAFIEAA